MPYSYLNSDDYKFRKLYENRINKALDALHNCVIKVEHISPWTLEDLGKWEFQSTIWSVQFPNGNMKYFEVYETRTGSYYTEYYYEKPQINEVKPKEVIQIIWEPV